MRSATRPSLPAQVRRSSSIPGTKSRLKDEQRRNTLNFTIPERAHVLVKFLYTEMKRQGISLDEMEKWSGVTYWTLRRWRRGKAPDLISIEACLSVVGYTLRAVKGETRNA